MSEQAMIGVVIVNYNSDKYLYRCIKSLLTSDTGLHIVVVDNKSSDSSIRDIGDLHNDSHEVEILLNDSNLGFSAAVNIGVNQLQTDLVMILNPDCYVHSHTLRKLGVALDEDAMAGIAGALIFNENGTEQRGCRRNEPTIVRSLVTVLGLTRWFSGVDLTTKQLPTDVIEVDAVSGAAMMLRRSCLDQIGGMDEGYFLHCEDLDVCRRIRDAGHKVIFVPQVSIFHKQGVSGGASYLHIEKLKHQGMLRYYAIHYERASKFSSVIARMLVDSHYFARLCANRVSLILQTLSFSTDASEKPQNTVAPTIDLKHNYVLVSGANSDVGDYLIDMIANSDSRCIAISRTPPQNTSADGVVVLASSYFSKAPLQDQPCFDRWINVAPIWSGAPIQQQIPLEKLTSIVALSSTSIDVKRDSSSNRERTLVDQLVQGEQWFRDYAARINAACIIMRPTMIYGGPRNRNINLIKDVIRICRFFPLAGQATGRRQPVHARDVARACLQAINLPTGRIDNNQLNIAGNEVLSYEHMVERVFRSMNIKPRVLKLPASVVAFVVRFLGKLPGFGMLTVDLSSRMERDQVFDMVNTMEQLQWQPGNFEP